MPLLVGSILVNWAIARAMAGMAEGASKRRVLVLGLSLNIGFLCLFKYVNFFLGSLFALRCPHDLDPLMHAAGGIWEPDSRRWLLTGSRVMKLVPALRRATDPLFRRAGINLDQR